MVTLSSIHKKKNVGVKLPENVKAAPRRKTKVAESVKNRTQHNMPYFEESDDNHAEHMDMLTQIQEDDPTLYRKMQAWE